MENSKKSLSIKNKILIVLAALPILSISLMVATATFVFKEDKLAYVYDMALSSTRDKASSLNSQMNASVQSLKALTANYNSNVQRLSRNGRKYFEAEKKLKAYYNFRWDGKDFKKIYEKVDKDTEMAQSEFDYLKNVLQEAWYDGFAIGVSPGHKKHFYISAKVGEEGDISTILVHAPRSFDLFKIDSRGESYLYHPVRGLIIGKETHQGLEKFLKGNVFGKKSRDGTKDAQLSGEEYLTSHSKLDFGKMVVVSTLNKSSALSAVKKLISRSLAFAVILLGLVIVIGVFASNGLTLALRSLADATSKVMDGDFTVRVEPKNNDEIGSLAQSFNKMTEEVSRLMEKTAENARMEAELKTAQTVQETLFPRSDAQIGPLAIYGLSEPASECGGDWWHYSEIGDKVYVWIGDATGHGVPAALLTSAARAVASVIEKIDDVTPAQALDMMNRAIYATSKGEMMMTFFIGCFDIKKQTFTYSNASHDPPFYLSKDVEGKPKRRDYVPLMEINNPRLGEKAETEYKDFEMPIEKGDKIVLYTDGIVDVKSPEGELWGERRFLKSLGKINDLKIDETVVDVFGELNSFRQETPLDDDVTLIVVEFEKEKAA